LEIREAAEQAKRELSSTLNTAIHLPYMDNGPNGPLHLQLEALDRRTLVELSANLPGRLELPCRRALEDAMLTADGLDRVVLVGGMTRMPVVQRKVEEILGKLPCKDVNPDEIVALGAAGQCAIMCGDLEEQVLDYADGNPTHRGSLSVGAGPP
jgi:molecular chaperone DnaK